MCTAGRSPIDTRLILPLALPIPFRAHLAQFFSWLAVVDGPFQKNEKEMISVGWSNGPIRRRNLGRRQERVRCHVYLLDIVSK
jgi:hypothetical protein